MIQLAHLKKFMEMVMLLSVENSEETEWEGQCLLNIGERSKARSDPKHGAVPELSCKTELLSASGNILEVSLAL